MKVPVENRNKLLQRLFAEDVNARFKVSSNDEGCYLRMSKWGKTATIEINDAFFEKAETDYRDSVVRKLYFKFAEALKDVEDTGHAPATPLEHVPVVGAGVPATEHVAVVSKDDPHVTVKPAEYFDMRDGDLTVSGNLSDAEFESDHELAPPNLQVLTVSEAAEVIEAVESPEVLMSLADQEREGKNRKGVIAAIEAALEGFAE